MNHVCPEQERLDELKSPRGQTAYAFYSEWMKRLRRSVPSIETFGNSKQYNYFVKFVDWSEKTAIPNIDSFIRLMVETGTLPVLWCRTNTYVMYLQWYDEMISPEIQFVETMDRLKQLAIELEVPTKLIYETLGAKELSNLVRKRKLSPWLLATSARFLKWATNLPALEREMVIDAVNIAAFSVKLKERSDLTLEFRNASEAEEL